MRETHMWLDSSRSGRQCNFGRQYLAWQVPVIPCFCRFIASVTNVAIRAIAIGILTLKKLSYYNYYSYK